MISWQVVHNPLYYLSFTVFGIVGDAGVQFSDMSITNAHFLGNTSEVIVAGRKPFYYSYDAESGVVRKIPGYSAQN
jgi:hypothetical protein